MVNEKNNPYYKAYCILSSALMDDKIDDGILKSLNVIKSCFSANNVFLHKVNGDGFYEEIFNNSMSDSNYYDVTSVINIVKYIVEGKKYYVMNLDLENMRNVLFFSIKLDITKYIITIASSNEFNQIDDLFLNLFMDTITIILRKYEMIKYLKKNAEIDILTGINNRKAYENLIMNNQIVDDMIFGLFDLFRLKNINDRYSHFHGDEYIRKTAQILKKYFSNNIYRIGGDEFALLSNVEKYENVLIKIKVIQEEVRNIDLSIDEIFGINYGLVVRKNNETYKDLYQKADKLLSQDKDDTYKKLGLERRR